jgi:hypothetical protein
VNGPRTAPVKLMRRRRIEGEEKENEKGGRREGEGEKSYKGVSGVT